MPRKPDIPRELLRELYVELTDEHGVRPTSDRVADVLSEMLDRRDNPIPSATIRSAVHRWGKDWELAPAPKGAAVATIDYRAGAALGPINEDHKRTWHWMALTAYERWQTGKDVHEKIRGEAESLVGSLLEHGDVVDYDPTTPRGFYVRPGLPWELGGYLRASVPTDGVAILSEALGDAQSQYEADDGRRIPITDEHREAWASWLEEHR